MQQTAGRTLQALHLQDAATNNQISRSRPRPEMVDCQCGLALLVLGTFRGVEGKTE
jgi:hypothetical protein